MAARLRDEIAEKEVRVTDRASPSPHPHQSEKKKLGDEIVERQKEQKRRQVRFGVGARVRI